MDMRPLSERWGVWKTAAVMTPLLSLLFVLAQQELQTVPRAVLTVVAVFFVMAGGRALVVRRDRRREAWRPPPPPPSRSS